jgi:hypothetical protein
MLRRPQERAGVIAGPHGPTGDHGAVTGQLFQLAQAALEQPQQRVPKEGRAQDREHPREAQIAAPVVGHFVRDHEAQARRIVEQARGKDDVRAAAHARCERHADLGRQTKMDPPHPLPQRLAQTQPAHAVLANERRPRRERNPSAEGERQPQHRLAPDPQAQTSSAGRTQTRHLPASGTAHGRSAQIPGRARRPDLDRRCPRAAAGQAPPERRQEREDDQHAPEPDPACGRAQKR